MYDIAARKPFVARLVRNKQVLVRIQDLVKIEKCDAEVCEPRLPKCQCGTGLGRRKASPPSSEEGTDTENCEPQLKR